MGILVTGAAGFIGFSVAQELLKRGDVVIGIDNLNEYYDPELKKARLKILQESDNFTFYKTDICDYKALCEIAKEIKIDKILHLAAQAGVRYSIENPHSYEESNNKGTLNMLEMARHNEIKHFVFASSSSVYGGLTEMPFKETQMVNKPISLYAATKIEGELMCYSYNHLYKLKCRCLRFFTVYGPWGRPDMALFDFTKKILAGSAIDVYNHGNMKRDFTYIADIVSGVIAAIDCDYDYEIFNLACGNSVGLMHYIEVLEDSLGKTAEKNMMGMQPGDVPETSADISKAQKMLNYDPKTTVDVGVQEFVSWYTEHYN